MSKQHETAGEFSTTVADWTSASKEHDTTAFSQNGKNEFSADGVALHTTYHDVHEAGESWIRYSSAEGQGNSPAPGTYTGYYESATSNLKEDGWELVTVDGDNGNAKLNGQPASASRGNPGAPPKTP
jgi:hypothetical protein